VDRFSFKPERGQIDSRFAPCLFKSDKLYNGMISEMFKTKELREWRGASRDVLQEEIVD